MLVCVCTREDIESICGASSKAHLLAFRHEQTIAKQAPSNALVPKRTHKTHCGPTHAHVHRGPSTNKALRCTYSYYRNKGSKHSVTYCGAFEVRPSARNGKVGVTLYNTFRGREST